MMVNTPLHRAAWEGNSQVLNVLINNGANIEAKDHLGRTALHISVFQGFLETTRILLNRRANPNAKNNQNNTPLHFAAWKTFGTIIQLLMENGADPDLINSNGDTPLELGIHHNLRQDYVLYMANRSTFPAHRAARIKDLESIKGLINAKYDFSRRDSEDWTPLEIAIKNCSTEIVFVIGYHNENLLETKDKNGWTPLHWAAKYCPHLEFNLICLLGKKYGLYNIDNENCTNLKENIHIVYYIKQTTKDGKTAIDMTEDEFYKRTLQYLIGENVALELVKAIMRMNRNKRQVNTEMQQRQLMMDSNSMNNLTNLLDKIMWQNPQPFNNLEQSNVTKYIEESSSSASKITTSLINTENFAFLHCISSALNHSASKNFHQATNNGVKFFPTTKIAIEFALNDFNAFVQEKLANFTVNERKLIHKEIALARPEIIASLERGLAFSGNIGLDDVLKQCKQCFIDNFT